MAAIQATVGNVQSESHLTVPKGADGLGRLWGKAPIIPCLVVAALAMVCQAFNQQVTGQFPVTNALEDYLAAAIPHVDETLACREPIERHL